MRIRETLSGLIHYIREHRISSARARLDSLLATVPRHWQSKAAGGGTAMQLGETTREKAIAIVNATGAQIIYIDNDAAFIATQDIDADADSQN